MHATQGSEGIPVSISTSGSRPEKMTHKDTYDICE